MKTPFIHIENLSIGRKTRLFESINLKLDQPGLVVLSGPNGIGKSTFLKTISGLIPALTGQIVILNEIVNTQKRNRMAQLVSFVGTERIRDEYITIMDLVRYGQFPYLQTIEAIESEKLLDRTMEMLNLNLISGKYLNTISDGEWQKANIARALVQNTPIIIMDEPSAFLDYPSKIKLYKDLAQIAIENSKLIICSTHDMELANRYGHYFWHLDLNGFQSSEKPYIWE